jgi:AcrR family transcriptional regulator
MAATPESARRDTAEAILQAARRRYARFGPRKTTMGEVAREAGCSRATLYLHFPSKQALYAGLLERETGAFLAELERAPSGQSAGHKLVKILRATLQIYSDSPVLRDALTGDDEMTLEGVTEPAVAAYESRVLEVLRTALEEGVAEGLFRDIDTEAVAYLMYQLGRVLVTREVTGRGDYDFERVLGVMDDLVAHGITRRRKTARGR